MNLMCWLFHRRLWAKLIGAWDRPAFDSHQIGWYCTSCCKTRGLWLYPLLFPYRKGATR